MSAETERAKTYLRASGWICESVNDDGKTYWRDPLAEAKPYYEEKKLPNGEPLIVDGEPVRQLVTPKGDAPHPLVEAVEIQRIRDRAAGKTPPDLSEPPQTDAAATPEDWKARVAAVVDENAVAIMCLARDATKTTDQKMREIYAIDNRAVGWDSPKWANVLQVSAAAIRKNDWWKIDRPRLSR